MRDRDCFSIFPLIETISYWLDIRVLSRFRSRDFYKAKDPLGLEERRRQQFFKHSVPGIVIILKEFPLNARPNTREETQPIFAGSNAPV